MDDTYIKAGSAISRAGTLGTGALTGSITGGLGSLSRTDEPARLIGGFTGGALGGTVGSILPAAVLNSQTAVKMLNSPKAKGFATLFKILNVLLAAGGGAAGSKMGENVASVIKNNMGNKVNTMYKQASPGVNGLIRLFASKMGRPMGAEAVNYLRMPMQAKGVAGVSRALKGAKTLRGGTRGLVDQQLARARDLMGQVTSGPHFNSPWSFTRRTFGNDINTFTPQELLNFVKKMNS